MRSSKLGTIKLGRILFAEDGQEILSGQETRDSSYTLVLSGFHYPKSTVKLINWSSEPPRISPDRGTKYSTTVNSQDYRYFIEMPTTWVPFPKYIEPDLPGSDFVPVRSTRRRYFAIVEARLHFKWKLFMISLLFSLYFEPNSGQHEYSAYENPRHLEPTSWTLDGRPAKEIIEH